MIKGRIQTTKDDILSIVSEEDLFRIYCSNFKQLNISFRSELREDRFASCRVTDLGHGLRYKDFGSVTPATDIWGYIMLKYSISYEQTIDKVFNDLKTNNKSLKLNTFSQLSITKDRQNTPTIITIKAREWLVTDKQY